MDYAAIYEKPEEASLEELGMALVCYSRAASQTELVPQVGKALYAKAQAIVAELARRDAAAREYLERSE